MALWDWQKKAVIRNHPFFSQLTTAEIEKLASLVQEKSVAIGETIVTEGDPVDSIYFIESGTAEVRHIVTQGQEKEIIPVAILNPGEAVGISDVGLFSTTGKRTATVVALTSMVLLRLDLDHFNQFLKSYPKANTALFGNAEMMSRINLIKQAVSFAKFPVEKISWLAEQVELITVEKGKIIFNKGDVIDCCYLIYTGEVEIFVPNTSKSETRLVVLKSQMVFGEKALLMNLPRNSSARALTDCQLLVMKQSLFQGMTASDENVANALMVLSKSGHRPNKLPHIESYTQREADHETSITLKDPAHDEYIRISQEEGFIWLLLDGKHTLRDITLAFYKKYNVFNPGLIAAFITDLGIKGFIENLPDKKITAFNFIHANTWFTEIYKKGVFIFYTWPMQLIFLICVVVGLSVFVVNFNYNLSLFYKTQSGISIFLLAVLLTCGGIFLQSLADGFTIKKWGHNIRSYCLGWSRQQGPVAFCDLSDMWLSSKWQQVSVDLTGVYLNILLAGIASLLALLFSSHFIILVLAMFAMFNYIIAIVQLPYVIKTLRE